MYLALGDSVPAGVGADPGESGYPELLLPLLENGHHPAVDRATPGASVDFELVNVTVPGATTTNRPPWTPRWPTRGRSSP